MSAPTFLLTNDDGAHAKGLLALRDAMATRGRVVVVAPDRELSGVGHGITLNRPLRIREDGPDFYVVDGTPTDCVNLGILKILGALPKAVIAGINRGANLGDDVTYSGTVAGAMEGALLGVPSMAVSLESRGHVADADRVSFGDAAGVALRVLDLLSDHALPARTLVNVNVPARKPLGRLRVTRQGRRSYEGGIVEKVDPRGTAYYWIGGTPVWADDDGADQTAVARGDVSITPLMLDLTHHGHLAEIARVLDREG
ncbi:MAG: 5'/3'-nucleotidase SurE [Acidobacteriota bacterium]